MRRGLVATIDDAHAAIARHGVRVSGAIADKPGRLVAAGEPIELLGPGPRFVSRGGQKLDAALETFAVPVAGRRALDAGSSTGGFTDCLLQRGASGVVAVDVGTHQLHERLRGDPRVELHEQTNLRHLRDGDLGEPFEVLVADLSFISLAVVVPMLVSLAAPGADLVCLVKPQFEASKAQADEGRGVISDPLVWLSALERVAGSLEGAGTAIMGAMASPVRGTSGNVEFLLHARVVDDAPASEGPPVDFARLVADIATDIATDDGTR